MNENAGTTSSELSVSQLVTGIGKLVFDISKQTATIAEKVEALEGLVSQGLFERLDRVVLAIEALGALQAAPSESASSAGQVAVPAPAAPPAEGAESASAQPWFPIESLTTPLEAGLEKLDRIEQRVGSIEKSVGETAAAIPQIASPIVLKLEALEARTESMGRELIASSGSLTEKTLLESAELKKLLASQEEKTAGLLEAVVEIGKSSGEVSKAAADLPARLESLNGTVARIPDLVQERLVSTTKDSVEPIRADLAGMGGSLAEVPLKMKAVEETLSGRIDDLGSKTAETIKGLKDVLDSQQALLDDMRITVGEASSSQEKSMAEMAGLLKTHRDAVIRTQVDDLNNEAIQHFNRGDLTGAAASIKAALDIDADRPELWVNSGHIRASSGSLKEAEEDFRKALSIQPDMEPALSGLGLLLVKAGRPRDTLDILARYLDNPAPSSKVALACARAMTSMERHAEAITLLERALAADPGNPDLESELASYKAGS